MERRTSALWTAWLLTRAVMVTILLSRQSISDVGIYANWAHLVQHGGVPYVSFYVEYPPGILPFFLIPAHSPLVYRLCFTALAVGADAGVLRCLICSRSRGGAGSLAAPVWIAAVPALGTVSWARLDIFVAFLLVLALERYAEGRMAWAGGLLAGAALLKLWPAVLVLLLLPGLTRELRSRLLVAAVTVSAVPLVFCAALGGAPGLWWMLRRQGGRGLEVESVFSVPVQVSRLLGARISWVWASGSVDFNAHDAGVWLPLANAAFAVALLTLAVVAVRRRASFDPQVLCLLLVIAVLVTSKVLSPQYLLWLAGPACLVVDRLRHPRALAALLLSVLATTQMVWPTTFASLADGRPLGVIVYVVRTVMLIALALLVGREAAVTTRRRTVRARLPREEIAEQPVGAY